MLKLPVDKVALDEALEDVCFKCGSTRIVSSVTILDAVRNPRHRVGGWVCKQCRDDMLSLVYERKVRFGDEGFLDDNLTRYDFEEIVEKVDEFNELFEDKGCSAQVLPDDDCYCCIEIIVDDGQPEPAAAVKAAESIEKLCKHKIAFSRRQRP